MVALPVAKAAIVEVPSPLSETLRSLTMTESLVVANLSFATFVMTWVKTMFSV